MPAAPGAVLDHAFATWASTPEAIGAESREAYRRALTSSTIAAICADYRASFHLDRQHDADDRAGGRRIGIPLLLIIGEDETQLAKAPDIWRAWAHSVTVRRVPGGHFSPEEAPHEVAAAIVGASPGA